ncbi:MAG: hypothetical protein LBC97_02330, partial [Bifidobacteriaceae bacterium]|nr:hypothetical protein [Bifidobacteriaceae bacterium]
MLQLVLPDGFDEYAWVVEAKGWYQSARLKLDGRMIPVEFYDPCRLAQTVADEVEGRGRSLLTRVIVVERVTREAMIEAVAGMT